MEESVNAVSGSQLTMRKSMTLVRQIQSKFPDWQSLHWILPQFSWLFQAKITFQKNCNFNQLRTTYYVTQPKSDSKRSDSIWFVLFTLRTKISFSHQLHLRCELKFICESCQINRWKCNLYFSQQDEWDGECNLNSKKC